MRGSRVIISAPATEVERAHDHVVALFPGGDVGGDGGDGAGHFVAHDQRRADALVHVALEDVQVGAAHAAIGNFDADFAGFWIAGGGGADFDGLVAFVVGGFHGGPFAIMGVCRALGP